MCLHYSSLGSTVVSGRVGLFVYEPVPMLAPLVEIDKTRRGWGGWDTKRSLRPVKEKTLTHAHSHKRHAAGVVPKKVLYLHPCVSRGLAPNVSENLQRFLEIPTRDRELAIGDHYLDFIRPAQD